MNYLKNKKIILLLTCLFISLSLSSNYLYRRILDNAKNPFNLSYKYKEFTNTETNFPTNKIYDQIDDLDITLITTYNEKSYAGFFDTRYFYNFYLKYSNGEGRYFSKDDYKNRSDIAFSKRWDENNDNLYKIKDNSPLDYREVTSYKNLFVLDYFGNIVYLDSEDSESMEKISRLLKDNGYKEKHKIGDLYFLKLLNNFSIEKRAWLVYYIVLIIYLLAGISAYFYKKNNLKIIQLYYLSSNSKEKILKELKRIDLMAIFYSVLIALPILLLIHFNYQIKLNSFIFTTIVHILYFMLIFNLGNSYLIKNINRNMEVIKWLISIL